MLSAPRACCVATCACVVSPWPDETADLAAFFANTWPNTHPIFVTHDCNVTFDQTEITCMAPEGFGVSLQFAVYIDGVVSAPSAQPGIVYGDPTLESIAVVSVNVTTYSNVTDVVSTTITSVFSRGAASLGATPGERMTPG